MKQARQLISGLLIYLLILSLSGCGLKPSKETIERMPVYQQGSVWASENGEADFTVEYANKCIGKINLPDEQIDVIFRFGLGWIQVFPIDIYYAQTENEDYGWPGEYLLEYWHADFYSNDEFSVIVKQSTYFNVGDQFVFHKSGTD